MTRVGQIANLGRRAEAGAVDPAPRPAAAAPGTRRPGAITALAFITALQGPNSKETYLA